VASHLTLREKIAAGEVLAPTFVAAGPPLHVKSVTSVEAAVAAVRAAHPGSWAGHLMVFR
jgi:hypothetical protein